LNAAADSAGVLGTLWLGMWVGEASGGRCLDRGEKQSPCQSALRFSETPLVRQEIDSFAMKTADEALLFLFRPRFSAL